jgi:hypothetical protein
VVAPLSRCEQYNTGSVSGPQCNHSSTLALKDLSFLKPLACQQQAEDILCAR